MGSNDDVMFASRERARGAYYGTAYQAGNKAWEIKYGVSVSCSGDIVRGYIVFILLGSAILFYGSTQDGLCLNIAL